MAKLRVGDVVTRKSYNGDVYFKVIRLYKGKDGAEMAEIKGLDVRLHADSPVNDLCLMSCEDIQCHRDDFIQRHFAHFRQVFARRNRSQDAQKQAHEYLPESERKLELKLVKGPDEQPPAKKEDGEEDFFEVPGRVLHIDGDSEYLKLCLATYRKLNICAWGYTVPEENQPRVIGDLLKLHLPDILVLTGHDGLLKGKTDLASLDSYRNSRYFVEAVKAARRFELGRDVLSIFAGACQSYYEAILAAGANFASSPKRVLIHAFDPVLVVEKLAYTPFSDTVSVSALIGNTVTGVDGIGGMESRGKFRRGRPLLTNKLTC